VSWGHSCNNNRGSHGCLYSQTFTFIFCYQIYLQKCFFNFHILLSNMPTEMFL
jgi:hypothetical protein